MHMYVVHRLSKGMLAVFLLAAFTVLHLGIAGWAGTPIPSDLQIVSIASSFSGDAWVVQVTLDVAYDPVNEVSSLVVTAYDSATGSWNVSIDRVSIDDPFQSSAGSTVTDYMVTLDIPKTDSGQITIEARAAHGDAWGSTSWEGWIPQEASYVFSGELAFPDGAEPKAVGAFESTQWILSVNACGKALITLHTLNCRLLCSDPDAEIPSWWRVWDSNSNNDGEPDPGELVDSGWISGAEFIAHWNLYEIEIPSGWSGKITFQMKMERSRLGDHAGTYSATLKVDVCDGS